jgi:hypothetical protein
MRSYWPRFGVCMRTTIGFMGPKGVASAAPGRHCGGPLHRGTANGRRRVGVSLPPDSDLKWEIEKVSEIQSQEYGDEALKW